VAPAPPFAPSPVKGLGHGFAVMANLA